MCMNAHTSAVWIVSALNLEFLQVGSGWAYCYRARVELGTEKVKPNYPIDR